MSPGMFARVIALAVAALMTAAGVCLLDGDRGATADPGLDFCATLLLAPVGLLLGFPLALVGRSLPALARVRLLLPPDLPVPPPRP